MPPPVYPWGADPWRHLGLPRGSPAAEVRRAYARLLKSIDQKADPEAFRILRAAFEAAGGTGGGQALPPDGAAVRQPATAAYQEILDHCLGGRLVEAARLFGASVRTHRLSFDEEESLSLRLAQALRGPELRDRPALEEISALMAWEMASRQNGADPAIVRVIAARDAGRWLAELEEAAAMRRRPSFGWLARRRAARSLLKPAPRRLARILAYFSGSRGLDYWVEGVERHRAVLDDWLDPGRLDWCMRQVKRRRMRNLLRLAGIVVLMLAAGTLAQLVSVGLSFLFLG